jgi:hypothetical protein
MFETGIATHSKYRMDPVLHLIVRSPEWVTWCGGGLAQRESTVTQRRCKRCLALARRDITENDVSDDEASDLDWYLGRQPTGP